MSLLVAFIQFVHDGNCDGGSLADCHNMICRWADARAGDRE